MKGSKSKVVKIEKFVRVHNIWIGKRREDVIA